MQQIRSKFKNSLALRYLSIITSFMLLTEMILGLVQIRRISATQHRALEHRVDAQATLISEVVPEAILSHNFLYLETLSRHASEDDDILYAVVVDINGKPLTRYLNQSDERIQQVARQQAENYHMSHAVITHLHQQYAVGQVRKPVTSFDTPLGEVWLGYSDENIQHDVREMAIHTLLSSMLLSLLLALLTILLFERQVRRPLSNLSECAKALALGDFSQRFSSNHNDEISQLERAFEQMANQLQKNLQGLAAARDGALAASRAKSEFLASMSHELRTPLNAILGFSQLMTRDIEPESEQYEKLTIINQSGEHLLFLINDVLEMSKIESGHLSLDKNSFDFPVLISSIKNMLSVKAKDKNLELKIVYQSEIPQFIRADEGKLRQVLINLIGNAIKFTEEGSITLLVDANSLCSSIDESSEKEPRLLSQLRFTVRDTGIGIPASQIEEIFNAFAQTSAGRKSQDGTGLGLSISRKYVQLMGGDLVVESQLGQGSEFSFMIQVDKVDAGDPRSDDQRCVMGLAPNSPKGRILIADDIPQNRRLLQQLMALLELEVKQAKDGLEAISIWEAWQPNLIWMDMQMPIVDGFEATQQIRNLEKNCNHQTFIVALTASAFDDQHAKMLAAGCDDYVCKPFQENEIFDKLSQFLDLKYVYINTTVGNDEAVMDEDVASPKPSQNADLDSLLKSVPQLWVSQLNQAATQLDEQAMQALIKGIQPEHPALAKSLNELLVAFRFDVIAIHTAPFSQ